MTESDRRNKRKGFDYFDYRSEHALSIDNVLRLSSQFPGRIFYAYLAEDYDGKSQFALIKMTRGGVASGYKVRVAAGDHSGHGPIIPENTRVVITAVNGTVEVLLGQKGRAQLRQPQGAFAKQDVGIPFSGIPILREPTIPGNVLIAFTAHQANASIHTISGPRFLDNPSIISPPIPAYPGTGLWTVLATNSCWNAGQNIGPPGAVNISASWRFVQPREVTTHPVAVSSENSVDAAAIWLYEIPIKTPPTGWSGSTTNDTGAFHPPGVFEISNLSGYTIGIMGLTMTDYSCSPMFMSAATGYAITTAQSDNDPTPATEGYTWNRMSVPYVYIGAIAEGGPLSANVPAVRSAGPNDCSGPFYTSLGIAAAAISFDLDVSKFFPTIPYPANQT